MCTFTYTSTHTHCTHIYTTLRRIRAGFMSTVTCTDGPTWLYVKSLCKQAFIHVQFRGEASFRHETLSTLTLFSESVAHCQHFYEFTNKTPLTNSSLSKWDFFCFFTNLLLCPFDKLEMYFLFVLYKCHVTQEYQREKTHQSSKGWKRATSVSFTGRLSLTF